MENKKVAFITGISGQDGSYLAEFLLKKGYEVHGLVRRTSSFETWWRLDAIKDQITTYYGDMTDPFSLMWALKKSQPDEVYNLAAMSHVQVSWDTPYYTAQTVGIGMLNLLESIMVLGLECKVYQASTSELFSGDPKEAPQNEKTPFNPASPYGTAKLYAFQIAKNYRDAYGIFICNGILFNHESERRGDNFVTKKIVNAFNQAVCDCEARDSNLGGHTDACSSNHPVIELGDTSACRDWGYAPEYVECMWKMLQEKKPDDYVIATGETHTVEEFVGWVEKFTGKQLKIVTNARLYRPQEVKLLRGDATKAKLKLDWEAQTKGEDIARKMLNLKHPPI